VSDPGRLSMNRIAYLPLLLSVLCSWSAGVQSQRPPQPPQDTSWGITAKHLDSVTINGFSRECNKTKQTERERSGRNARAGALDRTGARSLQGGASGQVPQPIVVLLPGLLSALGLESSQLALRVMERHSGLSTAVNPLEWGEEQRIGASDVRSQAVLATGGATTVEVESSNDIACISWRVGGGGSASALLLSPDAIQLA